jgi:four helix bundle protein
MDEEAIGVRQQAIAKKVNSYKDLVVWQKSMDLVEAIYRLTENLPMQEQWGLSSQMRRAAISVPSNIAEGYGRHATGEYHHHLSIARGSLLELETQALVCHRLNFCATEEIDSLLSSIQELIKMLSVLISKIH